VSRFFTPCHFIHSVTAVCVRDCWKRGPLVPHILREKMYTVVINSFNASIGLYDVLGPYLQMIRLQTFRLVVEWESTFCRRGLERLLRKLMWMPNQPGQFLPLLCSHLQEMCMCFYQSHAKYPVHCCSCRGGLKVEQCFTVHRNKLEARGEGWR